MKKTLITALAVAALSFAGSAAYAATTGDGPSVECTGIKIATGPSGKGYANLFSDIKKVCGSKVSICEEQTTGGLDNITSLSQKEVDMGFVQVDTWTTMKTSDDNIASLQKVVALNNNYLHIVTNSAGFTVKSGKKFGFLPGDAKTVVISQFSDLRGQQVAAVGSAELLAHQLNKQLGYGMQIVAFKNDDAAFAAVKNGTVAAALSVSGWPSGAVKKLSANDGLTLVPFNATISAPYKVKSLNYKNIAVYNVNSLAVQNVLVTRPFSGSRAANVSALQSCIMSNLTELAEGNYQPAWNEVSKSSTIPEMTDFKK